MIYIVYQTIYPRVSAVNIEIIPAPIHLHTLPPPPFRLHPCRMPIPVCSARPCGEVAGRRFCGTSWMHGYPTVWGCEVDVISVSCRRQLKYNFYVIMHRKERKGRKANPTESFAIFALFAVK